MTFRIVIPARIASQRLHQKMLADIVGIPMVIRTWTRARLAGAESVVIATDDTRIMEVAHAHGADAVLTGAHPTGTDRVAEAVRLCGWPADALVINVQGDEPLVAPEDIVAAGEALARSDADMATLSVPLRRAERDCDSVVKVVGSCGRAHWFSRAGLPGAGRHLGVYAWRVASLFKFSLLPRTYYEQVEMLEQLRAIEHGMIVKLGEAPEALSISVDTQDDLARVRAQFQKGEIG